MLKLLRSFILIVHTDLGSSGVLTGEQTANIAVFLVFCSGVVPKAQRSSNSPRGLVSLVVER